MKNLFTTFLFILLIILLTIKLHAQEAKVYRFRTMGVAFLNKEVPNPKYDEWQDHDALVIADMVNSRITIYSKTTMKYDITSFGETEKDKDGDTSFEMKAIDYDGRSLTITLANRHSQGGQIQLYFDYSNVACVYALKVLD